MQQREPQPQRSSASSANIAETRHSPKNLSFLGLMEVHHALNEAFYRHQEALLLLDLPLARERLAEFEHELREHMRFEEEVLLPVYERAGRIPGGPIVFFTGEHKRMLEFLGRFQTILERLPCSDTAALRREVIELFDQQAMFKHLVEHHDLREQNILYPTLDRLTDDSEKNDILAGVFRDRQGGGQA